MHRHGMLLVISIVAWTGCRGTTASFDPFAPYGSRRVPPPATGTIGQATPYSPPAGTPPGPADANIQSSNDIRSSLEPAGLVRNEPTDSTRWRNASPVDPASHATTSTLGASGGDKREFAANLRPGENLQWARPSLASQRSSWPSNDRTQASPAAGVPPAPLHRKSPSPVSPEDSPHSADTPRSFTPRGELIEITQLPRYGYTPESFNPRIGARPVNHLESGASNDLESVARDRGSSHLTPTPGKTVVGSGLQWRPRTTR